MELPFKSSSFGLDRSVLRFLPMCIITSKFHYDNSSSVWHRSSGTLSVLHIHWFNWALFHTENVRVSGKQRRRQRNFISTCCPLHCTIVKIVTNFALNSNKTPLRQYSLRRPFAQASLKTSEGLGWGWGDGYGISMGLEYFQKFLDKPMQRESDFGVH